MISSMMSASIIIRGNIRLINARPITAPAAGGNIINIASNMISSYEHRRAGILPQMTVMFGMTMAIGLPFILSIRLEYPAEFVTIVSLMAVWAICICGGAAKRCMTRTEYPIRIIELEDGCEVRANTPCIINIVDLGQQYYLLPA